MAANYEVDYEGNPDKPYGLLETIDYYSMRYGKRVVCNKGMRSDGATGAFDIFSEAWWVHDQLCDSGVFADGTRCTTFQASMVLRDILLSEGHWFRAHSWFLPTLVLGGGKTRKNVSKHKRKSRKRRRINGPRR